MKWSIGLAAIVFTSGLVHAHHIWIVPTDKGDAAVVAWNDQPAPDNVEDKLTTIANAKVFMRRADGSVDSLKWREDNDVYRLNCPGDDERTLAVIWDGQNGVHYFAKAYLPDKDGKYPATENGKVWERLVLEIVPRRDRGADAFQALFKGRPLANARVHVSTPEKYRALPSRQCDKEGLFTVAFPKAGVYGFHIWHEVKEKGEEVTYASTLVIRAPGPRH